MQSRLAKNTPEMHVGEDSPTVLVVDDDRSVRRALRRLLKSAGRTVQTFDSAEDLLRDSSGLLENAGCLVLDVRMPGLTGLDLQRQLGDAESSLPIIFITAHEDEDARLQAIQAGAAAFLLKPFDGEQLLRAIDAAIDRQARGNRHSA